MTPECGWIGRHTPIDGDCGQCGHPVAWHPWPWRRCQWCANDGQPEGPPPLSVPDYITGHPGMTIGELMDAQGEYWRDVGDPIFHGSFTDGLPDEHPLAYESVYCIRCPKMVHAANNELMDDWFETHDGPMCFDCFAADEHRSFPGPKTVNWQIQQATPAPRERPGV